MEGSGRPGAAEVWASPAKGYTRRGCSRCLCAASGRSLRPLRRDCAMQEYDLARQAEKVERWLLLVGRTGVQPSATGRGGCALAAPSHSGALRRLQGAAAGRQKTARAGRTPVFPYIWQQGYGWMTTITTQSHNGGTTRQLSNDDYVRQLPQLQLPTSPRGTAPTTS